MHHSRAGSDGFILPSRPRRGWVELLVVEARLDPYTALVERLADLLSGVTGARRLDVWRLIQPPPREEYGDLGFPLMRFTGRSGPDPGRALEAVRDGLESSGFNWVSVGLEGGYLNVRLDAGGLARELTAMYSSGWRPRVPPTSEPLRVVVEHTSANPIHPLHMGHARNASLGDTLARLLRARGHTVNTRFYVNDSGLQVAHLVLGLRLAGIRDLAGEARRLGLKVDRLAGWVYATTHTSIDAIQESRRVKAGEGSEGRLEELAAALARLKDQDPGGYFDRIFHGVESLRDPEAEVQEIVRRYEAGLEPERTEVRRVAEAVLEGFKETLARLGVSFDDWDWESDLLWSGAVARLLEEAKSSRYITTHKGALAIDAPRIVAELVEPDPEASSAFKLPKSFDIPPMILVRSDGTTLYATRDVAYAIHKFRAFNADRVINVVGADQRLEQLHVRLALLGLGYRREALNMVHYDYEIVRLPGRRMRSRRGEAVWLDDVIEEAKARAAGEVRSRNPDAPEELVDAIAEKVAVGAVRFALVQTSAPKPVTVEIERMLNLQENSGPYLQYTHARAFGILARHGPVDWDAVDPAACSEAGRRGILVRASRLPLVAAKAADDLAPEDLATYMLKLADQFNSWYQKDSVIHEPDRGARECKALIVHHFKENLALGLTLLGIPAPERM